MSNDEVMTRLRATTARQRDAKIVWSLVICLLLAALTWSVFGQTLGHDFINYDDPVYIHTNPNVIKGFTLHGVVWVFRHGVASNWHPLTMLTHIFDCQFYGLKPRGHHFTNVVLHIAAAVLLFLVLTSLTEALWRSTFVAALFAIHPLRAESVAWISERKDVLSAVFFMLTLAAYLRYVRNPSLRSYVLLTFVFGLGLMSKPMLVTAPLVLLLLDHWPLVRNRKDDTETISPSVRSRAFKNGNWIRLTLEKIPLLFLSLVLSVITIIVQRDALNAAEAVPLWVRIYNAFVSCVVYVRQLFPPTELALPYPYPVGALSLWTGLFALTILLAVTAVAWVCRKERPYLLTG